MRAAKRVVRAALVAALTLTACVGGKTGLSAEDKERLKPFVLESAPTDLAHALDINFENRIRLIGYRFDPELAPPGTTVKLTYYWRCDEPLEDGWQLFTHVQHEGAAKPENLDGNGPLREVKGGRQVLGPERWERGKIYVDEQSYTMPAQVKGPESMVYVGIWKGDARLHVTSGPNDGDNRAIVGKLRTGVARVVEKGARGGVPELEVPKLAAGSKIVVDGKSDDAAWQTAVSTGPFVDVRSGEPNATFPVNGTAKLAWDDEHLYVLFEVSDRDVVGGFTTREDQPEAFTATGLPMLWTRDTVEIMTDPDGDGDNKDYFELQVNPQNKVFHSQFDGYNTPKASERGPFGHEDWDPKLKSAVVVRGTMDSPGDKDDGYTVEIAIPWGSFKKGASTLPPKSGDEWRMNFYAMENNGGVAWSPIRGKGNFHRASQFGRVRWSAAGPPPPDGGALDGGAHAVRLGDRDGGLRMPLHIPRSQPSR